MKYLLLDSNIFLDMIIDRKNNVSKELVNTFIKLLDFNQVKLIIPSIVAYEVNKHIEEQLLEVEKKISNAIKAIDEIYGINGYTIEGLEVKDFKKNSKKELNIFRERYKASQRLYLSEIQSLFQKIIRHPNSMKIEDSERLNATCLQRRIYKKAPFHLEKKESFADGLIIEILLHIENFISLVEGDKIIFVTGNTRDFSDSTNKETFHVDIQNDLAKKNLEDKTIYVTHFSKLVAVDLEIEVKEAELSEEFEKEFREYEEYEKLQLESELEDYKREEVGLFSLGGFENYFLESFQESSFAETVLGIFERLNTCYSDASDLSYFYSEELPKFISDIEIENINTFISKWNELFIGNPDFLIKSNIGGFLDVIDMLQNKAISCDFSGYITSLPDSLHLGESVIFYNYNKRKYTLVMDELESNAASGDTAQLFVTLLDNKGKYSERGSIILTYGFVDYDDDGNIGDACNNDIEYITDNIVTALENITKEFEKNIKSDKIILQQLQTQFSIS